MGITYIQGQVKGSGRKQVDVRFLVDSGATYSLLPRAAWKTIGLKPKRHMTFTLADGTTVDRAISEAYVRLAQGEAHAPVILGEESDQALLGVVTLEILGLVFHPFDRTLHPMRMQLSEMHPKWRNEYGVTRSFQRALHRLHAPAADGVYDLFQPPPSAERASSPRPIWGQSGPRGGIPLLNLLP